VADDHGRIDELLAGFALRSLSGEDAREADRLLVEHVPGCPLCRETLEGFRAVAGDLALAAPPVAPPELLLARLRRDVARVPRRPTPVVAVAAGLAAILAMGTLAFTLGRRADEFASERNLLAAAVAQMPAGVSPFSFMDEDGEEPGGGLVGIPNVERVVLVGRGLPLPAPGNVYRVWLGADGSYVPVADFLPEDGVVVLGLRVDRQRFDELLITEEPDAPPGPAPRGVRRWSAPLP
jgi:hypothetical protein